MIKLSKFTCLVVTFLIGACAELGGLELSTVHTSALDVLGPGMTIPMSEYPLDDQQTFDTLETHLLARMGVEKVILLYGQLAEAADPKRNETDAMLLQRLALLHLRSNNDSGRLHQAFAVADRLRTEAPESPHTHYLLGHITSLLLPTDADRVLRIQPSQQDVARRLVQHWESLMSAEPEYVAPSGQSGADIRARLTAVSAALTRSAQPTGPDMKVESLTQEVPNPVLEERRQLHRLENGDQALRRTLCRERKESGGRDGVLPSEPGRWLALRCAVELEDAVLGQQAIEELVESRARIKPCRWLERLGVGQGLVGKELSAAMEKRGMAPCARKEN